MLITAKSRIVKPFDCTDGEVAVVVADKHSVIVIERQMTNFGHLHTTK